MAEQKFKGSAALHLRLPAFGGLFVTLVTSFEPLTAFIMTVAMAMLLAKM